MFADAVWLHGIDLHAFLRIRCGVEDAVAFSALQNCVWGGTRNYICVKALVRYRFLADSCCGDCKVVGYLHAGLLAA